MRWIPLTQTLYFSRQVTFKGLKGFIHIPTALYSKDNRLTHNHSKCLIVQFCPNIYITQRKRFVYILLYHSRIVFLIVTVKKNAYNFSLPGDEKKLNTIAVVIYNGRMSYLSYCILLDYDWRINDKSDCNNSSFFYSSLDQNA